MSSKDARNADNMGDIVSGLEEVAQERDEISIRSVIEEFGSRSFGPVMLILALIGMLPTGGIPGVPTAVAVTIALVSLQLLWGKSQIWLPGFIANRSVPSKKLTGATDKLDLVGEQLDKIAKGRLQWFAQGTALRAVGATIVLLCCFIPILELVPFAAAGPFAAIAILSLALIVSDGLLVLIGCLVSLGVLVSALVFAL
ncbi:MAG: exopolysaccharide biosynthesis protein [Pseudomonadota bacterium]